MNKIGKVLFLAAAAVLIAGIHLKKKKQMGAGWTEYGRQLLGIGAASPDRKCYLDELRFLAAMLVILVHSFQSGAAQLSMSPIWYFLTGASGLGLCCNLLFVFISGALLLPYREERIGSFYRKRVSKVAIPLIAYYLFYLRRSGLVSFSTESIGNAFRTILSGPNELVPHFWLVYVLVGLYVGVPFLRWLLKSIPDPMLAGLAGIVTGGAAIQTGLRLLGVGFAVDSFLLSWEGIFLLGYFLDQECCRKYEKRLLAGGVCSAAVIVWLSWTRADAAAVAANDSFFMILFAAAVFLAFRRRGSSLKCCSALVQIGSRYSYSVLLIHWFMLFVVVEKHLHVGPMMFGGAWMLTGILLQSVLAFLLSLVFAVAFDQTAVVMAEWVWEKCCQVCGKLVCCAGECKKI